MQKLRSASHSWPGPTCRPSTSGQQGALLRIRVLAGHDRLDHLVLRIEHRHHLARQRRGRAAAVLLEPVLAAVQHVAVEHLDPQTRQQRRLGRLQCLDQFDGLRRRPSHQGRRRARLQRTELVVHRGRRHRNRLARGPHRRVHRRLLPQHHLGHQLVHARKQQLPRVLPLGLPLEPLIELLCAQATFHYRACHDRQWTAFGKPPHDEVEFNLAHALQCGSAVPARHTGTQLSKWPVGTELAPTLKALEFDSSHRHHPFSHEKQACEPAFLVLLLRRQQYDAGAAQRGGAQQVAAVRTHRPGDADRRRLGLATGRLTDGCGGRPGWFAMLLDHSASDDLYAEPGQPPMAPCIVCRW